MNTLTQPIKLVGLRICHSFRLSEGDKKSVFRDYFRQYAARTLYFRALLCPLTFKTGGARAPA